MSERAQEAAAAPNFIRSIIEADIASGKHGGKVVTRFPPEPNGYLHIGHAKSICLNFGLARDFGGVCHLRFDDTNPETEDPEYVDSIMNDVRWLGFDWGENLFFASDYFAQLYDCAELLINKGLAYVDSQSDEDIRRFRGTVTEAGVHSPFRSRSVEENLEMFRRMRAGDFADGEHVLRAKIDMASPNMKMRDPLLYRIRHAHHYRTGDDWCIYPMYDFAHPLSDAIEGITHSVCTLEFENNREVYDWVLDHSWTTPRPHQYEFNRLNLDYTVMSKRKLLQLVENGDVEGWDDPRLPTIAGLRRRGVTPQAIRDFCDRVGVVRSNSRVDFSLFEYSIRDELNHLAPRIMAVVDPLRVVMTNYPGDDTDWLEAPYWPHDVPKEGSRKIPFGKVIYIEREDFMEDPPRQFFRLAPGREVRLRYAYFITCNEIVRNSATGEIEELLCTYDPNTRGGDAPDGRKVKATLHWVDEQHSIPAEFRLYDRLFLSPDPDGDETDWRSNLNPDSVVVTRGRIEPSVLPDPPETRYQFERLGYFWRDPVDSSDTHLVFNRIGTLRDTWAKITSSAATDVSNGRDEAPKSAKTESDQITPAKSEPARVQPQRKAPLSAEDAERVSSYTKVHGLDENDAVLLVTRDELADFFDAAVSEYSNARSIANWIIHELIRELKDDTIQDIGVTPHALAQLVKLVDEKTISGRTAKDVFARMVDTGEDPRSIVEREQLDQVSDESELEPLVLSVVEEYPEKVAEYRSGKSGLIGFFVGRVMKETGGTANPEMVRKLFESRLS